MELDEFQNFFFDLDKTLWNWDSTLVGAEDLIHTLRKSGKRVYFHTDNTLLTREEYAKKLTSMGITAEEEEVLTSSHVAGRFLESENITQAYIIGGDSLIEELEEREIDFSEDADVVVAGFDRQFSYNKLKRGMKVMKRDGRLYVCSTEETFRTSEGVIPHQGAINRALTTFGDAELLCKPGEEYTKIFKQYFSFFPGRSIFVGDRLADIETGNRLGMTTAAVMSGDLDREKLKQAEEIQKPDYGVSSLHKLRRKVL